MKNQKISRCKKPTCRHNVGVVKVSPQAVVCSATADFARNA